MNTAATKAPTQPASFLHPTLSAWRAAHSGARAVAIRDGVYILTEWRGFDQFQARFATSDRARLAILAGDVPWKPVKPAKAARWGGA